MTEIAIRGEQAAVQVYQQSSIDRLQKWAEQAVAVRQMADSICSTSFAPAAYRGKPDEATAAILAGAELGLDPMASLRAFDSIQGTPAPKAMTLRAVAQAAGHEVIVVESTPERAVVTGRRRGDQHAQTSVWDLARADAMGLTGKAQWKQQPAAMLVARATAEVCRWIASDAIMGMPYAAEEIGDVTGTAPQAVTRRVTAADIVGQAVAATTERPTVDTITAGEALARIDAAETLEDLDDVKHLCQAAGLRDPDVLTAWTTRAAQLGGEIVR